MNFWYRLSRFMSGRYGIDTLFYVLVSVSIVFSFINLFVRSYLLQIFVYLLLLLAFLRVVSRNHNARYNENKLVENFINTIRKKRDVYRQRRADTTHIYKKCPKCKAVLRLPRRKGKHTTICPKCNNSFKVNVK